MKTKIVTVLAVAALALLAGAALAGEKAEVVTLQGDVICAKCTLKTEGLTECQNVLRVAQQDAEPALYWITNNEVGKKVGHVCSGIAPMKITGTISTKDGITWITPTDIKTLETS